MQGRSYTYQFNDYAQTTGTVSNTDGSAQFFKLAGGNNTSGKANKLISESRVLKSTVNYITNPGFTRGYAGYWTYTNNSSGASVSIDAAKKNITDASLKVTNPLQTAAALMRFKIIIICRRAHTPFPPIFIRTEKPFPAAVRKCLPRFMIQTANMFTAS